MSIRRHSPKLAGIAALVVSAALIAGGAASGATAPTKAQMLAGKKVYVSAGCGHCHTLKAAKSTGTVGPNLNTIKPTLAKIITQVTQGGRFMPAFGKAEGGNLSATQIKDVSAFVYGAEHHLIS